MDTVKFCKRLDTIPNDFLNQEQEVNWQGLLWQRKAKYKYQVIIKNLRVTLYYKEFSIENSLHKFYHNNNYSIFTFKQMVDSIAVLDNYFDFSIYDADVIKYTPGLVVDATPEDSYLTWIDYKAKKILPMVDRKNGKVYGGYFKAGQVKIKGYNKTYEANKKLHKDEKITDALFRFEAEVYAKYIAKTYGLSILKVSDLVNYEKYCKSLELLLTFYDRIKKDRLDHTMLDCRQYRTLGIFLNSNLSHQFKLNHPHTHKSERTKFNALLKDQTYQKADTVREEICHTINTMKTF